MEILNEFVILYIFAICLALGYIIKHSIKIIPNDYIPLILASIGVILNVWSNGWVFTPEILLGGLASGLASTGAFEFVKNITKKDGK